MENSKLFNVYQSLTKQEAKRFYRMVQSAYQKEHRIVRLISYLIKYHDQWGQTKYWKKEKIYKAVFGKDTPYNDLKLRETYSGLYAELKRFIMQEELKSDDFFAQLYLVRSLRKRKANKAYNAERGKLQERLNQHGAQDAEFYQKSFLVAKEDRLHHGQQHLRVFDKALQEMLDALDAFYFSLKLRESCEMLNLERIQGKEYKRPFLDDLVALLERENSEQGLSSSVEVYLTIYRSLTEGEEVYFDRMQEHLGQLEGVFTEAERRGVFTYMLNFCISKVNRGQQSYYPKLLDLYLLGVDKGLILDQDSLHHNHYKSMVTIAIRMKRYEMAESILEDYRHLIHPNWQENAYFLNLSDIRFAQKKYDLVLDTLNRVEFTDGRMAASAKKTQLQTYYHLREETSLPYLINAIKIFIKRNKELPDMYKEYYLNFVKAFQRLVDIDWKRDYMDHKKRIEKIEQIHSYVEGNPMFDKVWLRSQIVRLNDELGLSLNFDHSKPS